MAHETQYIKSLLENGNVEIRANIGGQWWIGIFEEIESFNHCAAWAEREGGNVFATINPTGLQTTGRLRPFSRGSKNRDILKIARLPFDFDPRRDPGVAATLEQVAEAWNSAEKCAGYLSQRGWPEQIKAMSGNGYHLQYAVDLPNDPDTKKMLTVIYEGLEKLLTTDAVIFDVTVKNPGRIMRLYGTTNRKSGRRTTVDMPDELVSVPFGLVEDLAEELRPPEREVKPCQRPAASYSAGIDVVSWFKAQGLYKRHLEADKHAVSCPWRDKHSSPDTPTGTDTVIWENPGTYLCSHNSCRGKTAVNVLDEFAFKPETWGA